MQLIIGIIFVFITGPLASHLIMKAAYNLNTPATDRTQQDDFNETLHDKKL